MTESSLVYLDNNATTPVDPRVFDAMRDWFTKQCGNAASVSHDFGLDASDAVENAREQIADCLGAGLREIVFTSGATESNNLALKGVVRAAGPGSHLIVSAAEHKAVLDPARKLGREGFAVTVLPVDEYGCITAGAVAAAIRPETALVSIIFANNEVGSINPIAEIGAVCREAGVLFHSDAAQAFGKIDVDPTSLNVDLLSLSAHKLYGPKGIGALYVRECEPAIRIEPLFHGGGHENNLRSGTLPVPLIVGFGEASRLAHDIQRVEAGRLTDLREQLWHHMQGEVSGLVLNGHPKRRIPGNLNFSVPDVDGDVLLSEIEGIAISAGSACTSAESEPSYVLRAMGRSSQLARASLRFGFGRFNSEADAAIAADKTVSAIRTAQGY